MVGRSIARDLVRNGHDVLIVEQDPNVVRRETEMGADRDLDDAEGSDSGLGIRWYHGDACEVTTLHAAGFGCGSCGATTPSIRVLVNRDDCPTLASASARGGHVWPL